MLYYRLGLGLGFSLLCGRAVGVDGPDHLRGIVLVLRFFVEHDLVFYLRLRSGSRLVRRPLRRLALEHVRHGLNQVGLHNIQGVVRVNLLQHLESGEPPICCCRLYCSAGILARADWRGGGDGERQAPAWDETTDLFLVQVPAPPACSATPPGPTPCCRDVCRGYS